MAATDHRGRQRDVDDFANAQCARRRNSTNNIGRTTSAATIAIANLRRRNNN